MLLTADQLSCIRNHKPLFEDLSFELTSGQLLLVEGKNGAGKTSLLKILTGLRRADQGSVLWNQSPIEKADSGYQQQLAWIGHQNPIKDDLSALENLDILSHIRPRNQLNLVEALKQVNLGHVKHKLVKTFSAGMKRRLVLASLLVTNSKLWILDEPQAALDKAGIKLFENMAEQHLNQGGLIIMTSHHKVDIQADTVFLNLGHD